MKMGWTEDEGYLFLEEWCFYFHPLRWYFYYDEVLMWKEWRAGPFSVMKLK